MIDPIISLIISLIIFNGGFKIIKNAWKVLMERVPDGFNTDIIIEDMRF
jgi:cobalt-zinc-cadmium efflux system protein